MFKARLKVKKTLFLATVLILFSLITPGLSQEESPHKPIVEKLEVNWWQVPIFAVDHDGNPILDLKDADIEVWVNGKRLDTFTFYKRGFLVSQMVPKEETIPPAETPIEPPPQVSNQSLFLVFDTAMSSPPCTNRSKDIARKMITGAKPGSRFTILTIEPFKGLKHICGPSADKKELLDKIDKEVVGKINDRVIDTQKFFNIMEGGSDGGNLKKKNTTTDSEDSAIAEKIKQQEHQQVGAYFMRIAEGFFNSFETLYLLFNSIADNKFVYFFTEGISNAIVDSLIGGRTQYQARLKNAADLLGRSGAALFIINPMGVHNSSELITETRDANSTDTAGSSSSPFTRDKNLSGEDFLRYMTKESGGKYLEGADEKITATLEQMHRAYYEISFPDLPQTKTTTRDITIKPKRSGVFIHSLRSLEKNKSYAELSKIEKEILALNLISQASLLKTRLTSQHARVTRIKKHKNRISLDILLPEDFLNQSLDIYKFWVKDDLEVSLLDTSSLQTKKRKIQLDFERKENQDPGLEPYFALVNGTASAALVRVIGDDWVDPEDPKAQPPPSSKEKIAPADLQNILTRTADYCEKIKQSAFHFFCTEKIVESKEALVDSSTWQRLLNETERRENAEIVDPIVRQYPRLKNLGDAINTLKKYNFSYRLIKKGDTIKEERQWLAEGDNPPVSGDQVVKPTVFFSQLAIFAPVTLFAPERQQFYNYRFLGYDNRKGRSAVVIEALPQKPLPESAIYGKAWIDQEDFSVLAIEADPGSIKGFEVLKKIEKELDSRLNLILGIDFDELYDGIRFPTRVHMAEKYKGGRYVAILKGISGWLRNQTTFTYSDYQFFEVKMDFKIE